MSNEIDWSKAPEWATHWVGGSWPWHKHIGDIAWYWEENQQDWRQLSLCASDVEDEYRKTIVKRPDQAWNGTDLPPVGTVCIVYAHNTLWGMQSTSGCEREILAYHGEFVWLGLHGAALETTRIDKVDFKPIRTPEQIAAEEREKAVAEICRVCSDGISTISHEDASLLYDAGYRKTEAAK